MSEEAALSCSDRSANTDVGRAVLTEAIRHVDIINTSLFGMTAMILLLAGALSLPVFGHEPVTQLFSIVVIGITVFIGSAVLYYMNFKVHQHVASQAALTEVLVNSLGQGFLTFNSKGVCGNVYSQACVELLEMIPAGKNITDVLHIPDSELSDFKDWLDVLFMADHAMSFDDVVGFFPQFSAHSLGRRVRLIYRPIRNKAGALELVVVISTDETEQYVAMEEARRKQQFAEMISRIFSNRNHFRATLIQLRDFIAAANDPKVTMAAAAPLLRQLHTLKASVRHFCMADLGDVIQHMEAELRSPSLSSDEQFRKQLLAGRQRLSMGLDNVMGSVREIMGGDQSLKGVMREFDEEDLYDVAREMVDFGVSDDILRMYLTTIIAVPLRDCFRSFEQEVIDLINIRNKQISPIVYRGENPRVITKAMQNFFMSLSHIARNIVDHGIEAPAVRVARGKPPAGCVSIHSGIVYDKDKNSYLEIIIADDGNGIDPLRVREKLSVINPDGKWMDETDDTVIQHIFDWGFSTSERITETAGRGVGMEAVAREVQLLSGTISVSSVFEKSTTFKIVLPHQITLDGKTPQSFLTKGISRSF